MDLDHAKREFQKYVETFDLKDKNIKLKLEHSYRVMEISREIATMLNLNEEEIHLATLIGLLHDIGRFYQLQTTNSYNDKKLDHSNYGVMYLFEQGHIRDFLKEDKYDDIIRQAVLYHNDFELKDNLKEVDRKFCQIIRDADKIDIYRVYAEYFKHQWNIELVTPKVLEDFYHKKLILLSDIKTKSDSVMCILAFIMGIYFKESLELLEKKHNFIDFVKSVEVLNGEKDWDKIINFCNKIIESRDINVG